MSQLEVQIMGQSYMLTCPKDGEQRLREAVARVDSAMCNIRDTGKVKARDRIAVLAALNLTFELLEPLPGEAVSNAAQEPAAPVQKPASPAQTPGQTPAKPPEKTPEPPLPKPDETRSTPPHPQLETLLQRLNTALGTPGRRP